MNYRELLKKYMMHVCNCEGVYYLPVANEGKVLQAWEPSFSKEEEAVLEGIQAEINS